MVSKEKMWAMAHHRQVFTEGSVSSWILCGFSSAHKCVFCGLCTTEMKPCFFFCKPWDPESQGTAPLIVETTYKNADVLPCSLEATLELLTIWMKFCFLAPVIAFCRIIGVLGKPMQLFVTAAAISLCRSLSDVTTSASCMLIPNGSYHLLIFLLFQNAAFWWCWLIPQVCFEISSSPLITPFAIMWEWVDTCSLMQNISLSQEWNRLTTTQLATMHSKNRWNSYLQYKGWWIHFDNWGMSLQHFTTICVNCGAVAESVGPLARGSSCTTICYVFSGFCYNFLKVPVILSIPLMWILIPQSFHLSRSLL